MILTFLRTKGNIIARVDTHICQAARHKARAIVKLCVCYFDPILAGGRTIREEESRTIKVGSKVQSDFPDGSSLSASADVLPCTVSDCASGRS